MGLPELPEVRNMVDSYASTALREQLMERRVAKVEAPEKEVERLYKDATREWKLFSVMFEKEDDAKKMAGELKAGKAFEDLAKGAVAAGTAKGGGGGYERTTGLSPEIVSAVSKMAHGTVSPIIPLKRRVCPGKTGRRPLCRQSPGEAASQARGAQERESGGLEAL